MKINYELLFDLAEKQGIPIKKAKSSDEAGIYVSDGNGGEKEFTIEDLNDIMGDDTECQKNIF